MHRSQKTSIRSLAFMCIISIFILYEYGWAARAEIEIDNGWKFYKEEVANAQSAGFNDSAWETVNVPHTWNALDGQDGGANYYRGIGWYRKHVTVSGGYLGKRVFLYFDAVSKAADVYVNGSFVGRHEGAYAAFCFDVTEHINFGADNVFAVKADNSDSLDIPPIAGDFTRWGGICRSVHLVITDPVHVTLLDYASPGVYLTTTYVSEVSADLQVKAKIRNDNSSARVVTVRTIIKDVDMITIDTLITTQTIDGKVTQDIIQNMSVSNPHLWDGVNDPYLYKAIVAVEVDGSVVDTVEQPLGFRFFSVDPDLGFYLNGHYYDLHGVAFHEDRENKGRAISDVDRQQDMDLILELGCTFIRPSHYQHGERIYDIADAGGLVVWTELPIVNFVRSSTAFENNAKDQLRELIRQNYNHPSICFWSIFNELVDNSVDPIPLLTELNELAHIEDPYRLTTGASNKGDIHPVTYITDVIDYNKYYGWYGGTADYFGTWADRCHVDNPNVSIGVSEYGAGANIHQHEENPSKPITTGDWHPEEYQSYLHEVHWNSMKTKPFLWSKVIWNGFDFGSDIRNEGGSPGINDKGIVTRDRSIKKDAYYWYKCNWSNVPTVHITSRRFTPRSKCPEYIKVYSNCNYVELFINGVSRGIKTSSDHIFLWEDYLALRVGDNEIMAVGTSDGTEHIDSCNWKFAIDLSPKLPISSVAASTAQVTNEPENTIDGSLISRWAADGIQWIQYDLGQIETVEEIGISFYAGDQRVYTFDLDASNDSVNWSPVLSGQTSRGETTGIETFDIPGTSARYFRITGYGSTASSWNSYYEVEFCSVIQVFDCAYMQSINCRCAGDFTGPDGQPDCRVDLYDYSPVSQGWLGVEGVATHEAEDAETNCVVTSDQEGFTGTGFVDYPNVDQSGDYIRWTFDVSTADTYTLQFRFANGLTFDRPLEIKVNDVVIEPSLSFPPTGSWSSWSVSSLDAALVAGENTVQTTMIGIRGPNIDHLNLPAFEELPRPYGLDDLVIMCQVWLECNDPQDRTCSY